MAATCECIKFFESTPKEARAHYSFNIIESFEKLIMFYMVGCAYIYVFNGLFINNIVGLLCLENLNFIKIQRENIAFV